MKAILSKRFSVIFFFFCLHGMSIQLLAQTNSPCDFKYGTNEADSTQCIKNIAMFRNDSQEAHYRFTAWQNAVQQCPCSWEELYGYKISDLLNKLIREEIDSAQREQYIETLIGIPMAHHTHFPDKFSYGQALLYQCYYRCRYRCQTEEEIEQIFQDFTTAFVLEKGGTPYFIYLKYMDLAYQRAIREKNNTILFDAGKVVLPSVKSVIQQNLHELEDFFTQADSIQKENDILIQQYEVENRGLRIRYPDFEWCERMDGIHSLHNKNITKKMKELTYYALMKKGIESDWKKFFSDDTDEFFNYYNISSYITDHLEDYYNTSFEGWCTDIFEPLWKESHIECDAGTLEKRNKLLEEHWGDIGSSSEFIYDDEPPIRFSEKMPEFPGGQEALQEFIKNERQYPQAAKEAYAQGAVIILFVVERDGCLSSFKVDRPVHPALDAEAIRICKNMPKWKPGDNHGKKVRVYYQVIVPFYLE